MLEPVVMVSFDPVAMVVNPPVAIMPNMACVVVAYNYRSRAWTVVIRATTAEKARSKRNTREQPQSSRHNLLSSHCRISCQEEKHQKCHLELGSNSTKI